MSSFGAEMAPGWIGHVQRAVLRVWRVEPHAGVGEKCPSRPTPFGERSEPDFFLNAREHSLQPGEPQLAPPAAVLVGERVQGSVVRIDWVARSADQANPSQLIYGNSERGGKIRGV